MLQVPAMVLDTEESVYNFAINGGKVVFITEDKHPNLMGLPNCLAATVLLPPYEATAFELDGNFMQARAIYEQWLMNKECMDFINLIALSIMQNIPIGLYFGSEFNDMCYPKMLLEFFIKATGIQFGYGLSSGIMDEQFIPINLGNFLNIELIDIPMYFKMMPEVDITPNALAYLTNILKPPVKPGTTLVELNEYFKSLIKESHTAGKYLYSPIISGC